MNFKLSDKAMLNVQFRSTNSKINDLNAVQLWTLPLAWVEQGNLDFTTDKDVCFDCPFSRGRGCYVAKGYSRIGLGAKIKSLHGGMEFTEDWKKLYKKCEDKFVRFGAYGEPILIPVDHVRRICEVSRNWTGYTHQWRRPEYQPYQEFFMASVHSLNERDQAHLMGWRTFMVAENGHSPKDVNCPASKEAGRRSVCSRCSLCRGKSSGAKSSYIQKH